MTNGTYRQQVKIIVDFIGKIKNNLLIVSQQLLHYLMRILKVFECQGQFCILSESQYLRPIFHRLKIIVDQLLAKTPSQSSIQIILVKFIYKIAPAQLIFHLLHNIKRYQIGLLFHSLFHILLLLLRHFSDISLYKHALIWDALLLRALGLQLASLRHAQSRRLRNYTLHQYYYLKLQI